MVTICLEQNDQTIDDELSHRCLFNESLGWILGQKRNPTIFSHYVAFLLAITNNSLLTKILRVHGCT